MPFFPVLWDKIIQDYQLFCTNNQIHHILFTYALSWARNNRKQQPRFTKSTPGKISVSLFLLTSLALSTA